MASNKINRFYSPTQSTYIQQFIPERLPTDLMLQGLVTKQKQYDDQAAKINATKDWSINALPGYDTEYRDKYKQDLYNWADQMLTKDLSLPQYAGEYISKIREVKDNKDLQKIQSSYDTHQEYLKREKALKEGKGTDYDQAFVFNYQNRFGEYTKDTTKGGRGFTGDIQLGDPNALAGTDIIEDTSKLFDDMKANGSETAKFLQDNGYRISYKDSWEGVTDDRIKSQLDNAMKTYYSSRAGEQLQARFDMNNNMPDYKFNQLAPADKEKYLKEKQNFVYNEALKLGQEFVWGKSGSTKSEAYNIGLKYGREDKKDNPQEHVLQGSSATYKNDVVAYANASKTFVDNEKEIGNLDNRNKLLTMAQGLLNGKTKINDPNVIWNMGKLKEVLKGVPGAENLLSGKGIDQNSASTINAFLSNEIASTNMTKDNLELSNTNFRNREISALEKATGKSTTSTGVTYSDALKNGERFKKDPIFGIAIAAVDGEFGVDLSKAREELYKQRISGNINGKDYKDALAYVETLGTLNMSRKGGMFSTFERTFNEEGSSFQKVLVNPTTDTYVQRVTLNPDGTAQYNNTPAKTTSARKTLEASLNVNPEMWIAGGVKINGQVAKAEDLKGKAFEITNIGQTPINGKVLVETKTKSKKYNFVTEKMEEVEGNAQFWIPVENQGDIKDSGFGNALATEYYNNALTNPDSEDGIKSMEIANKFSKNNPWINTSTSAIKLKPGEKTSVDYSQSSGVPGAVLHIEKVKDANSTEPYLWTVEVDGKTISSSRIALDQIPSLYE